ncbi:sugar transferase [Candidatus Woesearchaeota archaeon]|nr:sugar transferase [Candidatus Woesearchaeota archaeon]
MGLEDLFYVREALGKDGKEFSMYKLRSMSPDADSHWHELVQSNNVDHLGKPANDPRITPLGRTLRRYWLDEIPELYHVLRRQMSLVGIRPRDEKAWSLYPPSHRQRALRYSPGLMGVQYSRFNKSLQELIEAESQYLDQKEKHPLLTDLKYFFLIWYNITFKGMRSR